MSELGVVDVPSLICCVFSHPLCVFESRLHLCSVLFLLCLCLSILENLEPYTTWVSCHKQTHSALLHQSTAICHSSLPARLSSSGLHFSHHLYIRPLNCLHLHRILPVVLLLGSVKLPIMTPAGFSLTVEGLLAKTLSCSFWVKHLVATLNTFVSVFLAFLCRTLFCFCKPPP